VLHGVPASYVLRLDRLPAAGFIAATAPQTVDPATVFAEGAALTALRRAGMGGAASAHYLRPVNELATANGPLDVVATVIGFSGVEGAHQGMTRLAAQLDARSGVGEVSAGDLGAESHAVSRTATAADGTVAVEVTVIWRVGNLLNEVAVRGREGGTGVGDAVDIAHRQADGEH